MRFSLLLAGLVGIAITVTATGDASAQTPPHWLCPVSWYNTLDGCDVGCGNYDPDCDTQDTLYNGCDNAYGDYTYDARYATSNPKGDFTCGRKNLGVPQGWNSTLCPSTWYDADDGCDCACGEVDPDCSDASDTFYCWSGSGTSCSPNATCETVGPTTPTGTVFALHFGGMCSSHFVETASSKLNNTVYRVRLANSPYVEVDNYIDMKTTGNIQATYNQVKAQLEQYCTGANSCYIYAYSAGASTVQYAINADSNPSRFHINGIRLAAGADGGSDLANWGRLAELAACPMASTLGKTTQRNLNFHNRAGQLGITVYRSGGKGHSALWPWGWSSAILWAGTSQNPGQDDGAVGLDSAGGCTSSAGRSDLACTKFTGNQCATSGCPVWGLDHYELKIKPMIEAGW